MFVSELYGFLVLGFDNSTQTLSGAQKAESEKQNDNMKEEVSREHHIALMLASVAVTDVAKD